MTDKQARLSVASSSNLKGISSTASQFKRTFMQPSSSSLSKYIVFVFLQKR